MMVVAQPDFEAPEVVSFFERDVQWSNGPIAYVETREEALAEVKACIARGARPTGDATRDLLAARPA